MALSLNAHHNVRMFTGRACLCVLCARAHYDEVIALINACLAQSCLGDRQAINALT